MSTCSFDIAWRGRCGDPIEVGAERCRLHQGLKCEGCPRDDINPATHSCHHTMGGLVCGANLCDECSHTSDRPMAYSHGRR